MILILNDFKWMDKLRTVDEIEQSKNKPLKGQRNQLKAEATKDVAALRRLAFSFLSLT